MYRGDYMKFNIKEEPSRVYYGLGEEIDLNSNENTPFAEIWNKSAEMFDMKYFNPKWPSIGLEKYSRDFMETRKFTYSALFPVNSIEGLNKELIVKIPAAKFIRFETTFEELTKGFIPTVYKYINENQVPVAFDFDYEEYPSDFDHSNPQSKVYVCFEYLGD